MAVSSSDLVWHPLRRLVRPVAVVQLPTDDLGPAMAGRVGNAPVGRLAAAKEPVADQVSVLEVE